MLDNETRRIIRMTLRRWGNAIDQIKSKQAEILEIKTLLNEVFDSIRSIPQSETHAVGRMSDPTAAHVERMVHTYTEVIERLTMDIQVLTALKMHVDAIVAQLSPEQRWVIELQYGNTRRSWGTIAAITSYSEIHVKRLNHEAIESIYTIMNPKR